MLPEREDFPPLSKGSPYILAEPGPPDGLFQPARVSVYDPRALDPEDALQVPLPVLAGAIEHFVRGDDERGGEELRACLEAVELHGLVQVVQRLVIVLESIGSFMEGAGGNVGVQRDVADGQSKDCVHEADVVHLA